MQKNTQNFSPGIVVFALFPFSTYATSPWHFDDGLPHEITYGYQSTNKNDIPILVSENNTVATSNTLDSLDFSTDSVATEAVRLQRLATLNLRRSTITTNKDVSRGINAGNSSLTMLDSKITTLGNDSSAIYASGGNLNLNNTSLSTTGIRSDGIYSNSSDMILNNVSIEVSGGGSKGIVTQGGSLYFSGNLHLKSDAFDGISVEGTNTEFNKASITVDNPVFPGNVILVRNSQFIANELNLVTKKSRDTSLPGRDNSIFIENRDNSNAIIRNSNIDTQGTGLLSLAGNLVLEDTAIKSRYGYALQIDRDSSAKIRGGSFESWGNDQAAIWAVASDSQLVFDIKNATLISHGENSQALNSQVLGPGKISDSSLVTTGARNYALYTDYSTVEGDGLQLRTEGESSTGVVAARQGTIKLSNSEIISSGDNSAGLFAFSDSKIVADGVKVKVTGTDGVGAATSGGTLYFNNSDIAATGTDAAGIYSSSFDSRTPGVFNLNTSKVTASKGIGILTYGGHLAVNLQNSTILGGCPGCQSTIYAANRLNNSTAELQNSLLRVNAENYSKIYGDVAAEQNSLLEISLKQNSLLYGAADNVSHIDIDNSSLWQITNNSVVNNLQLSGNAAFNANNDDFKTLTIINDLGGSGTFTFNTQLGGDDSQTDRLEVEGSANGNFGVIVKNKGEMVQKQTTVFD